MATMTIGINPTTVLLRYRVSCIKVALFGIGIARAGVGVVVGAMLLVDTALLFEAGLLVEEESVGIGEVIDGGELVNSM